MTKEYLTSEADDSRSYSRAVTVHGARKTIYLAGMVNYDEDRNPVSHSFEAATRAAFDRVRDTLKAAGGSLEDIVSMTVYITDPRWGDEFVKLRSEYFPKGSYPASALITVAGLGRPELMVEIHAVAAID